MSILELVCSVLGKVQKVEEALASVEKDIQGGLRLAGFVPTCAKKCAKRWPPCALSCERGCVLYSVSRRRWCRRKSRPRAAVGAGSWLGKNAFQSLSRARNSQVFPAVRDVSSTCRKLRWSSSKQRRNSHEFMWSVRLALFAVCLGSWTDRAHVGFECSGTRASLRCALAGCRARRLSRFDSQTCGPEPLSSLDVSFLSLKEGRANTPPFRRESLADGLDGRGS